jgi:predicted dinucleotide-binding enzyme
MGANKPIEDIEATLLAATKSAFVGALAENLGFSPIKLGGLSEGGLLVQARGNSWGQLWSSSTDES